MEKILSQDGIQTVELLQLIALFWSYRRIERRERKGPAREYMKKKWTVSQGNECEDSEKGAKIANN